MLVGGGDPTLAVGAKGYYPGAARLDQLAAQVKKASAARPDQGDHRRLAVRRSGLRPGWDADIPTGGFGGAITALMTDGARIEPERRPTATPSATPQPDLAAGQAFAKALGLPASAVSTGTAPAGSGPAAARAPAPARRRAPTRRSPAPNWAGCSRRR